MFPIILLSNNQKNTDDFILNHKIEHGFKEVDVQLISPLKATITIDQIRSLKKDLTIMASNPRLIIFEQFEASNLEVQNAMLKVLEDLNTKNQFILLVSRVEKLLPTITSRCRIVVTEFTEQIIIDETRKGIEKFLEKPHIGFLSLDVFQCSTKEAAVLLLTDSIQIMRQKMKVGNGKVATVIKKTFDLLHKLQNNNLSPQLTVDAWIILVVKSLSL